MKIIILVFVFLFNVHSVLSTDVMEQKSGKYSVLGYAKMQNSKFIFVVFKGSNSEKIFKITNPHEFKIEKYLGVKIQISVSLEGNQIKILKSPQILKIPLTVFENENNDFKYIE